MITQSKAFFPDFNRLKAQYLVSYGSLRAVECEIRWNKLPLSTRIWKFEHNSLEEWILRENQQLKVVGACLRHAFKVVASTFNNPSKASLLDYFLSSPKTWQARGIDFSKKKYVFWQGKAALQIGDANFCLYLANELFYPLGLKVGSNVLKWDKFVYLGNYYLPTAGSIMSRESFKIRWGGINSPPRVSFDLVRFKKRYSSIGSIVPPCCQKILNYLSILP
ncbi:MAG: hypothetical protein Q9M37_06780 [Desulfonauticus sp.]|nr:hypothetical protein [Desulfonauticus sp.]